MNLITYTQRGNLDTQTQNETVNPNSTCFTWGNTSKISSMKNKWVENFWVFPQPYYEWQGKGQNRVLNI